MPATGAYNATVAALVESNGGRNNIEVIPMWALFDGKNSTTGGFFSPCRTPAGHFTNSMVGTESSCDQYPALSKSGAIEEVSASGGYMLSQCSLPFASPGHLRGLTLQEPFKSTEIEPQSFHVQFNEHMAVRLLSSLQTSLSIWASHDPRGKRCG